MSPLPLEGDTLGNKHQHYNKLVRDAMANKQYELTDINYNDSDIQNLLKIDIASKTRNVDYIIEVFKSTDMLYASTAIRKSTWLITDQQYAHIINPEYLHTQLLPYMNTKVFNKLMLHIRLKLKDEKRVETFYEYLKDTDSAYKWLQNCSTAFIENVIQNERRVPLSLFKRLCRRSAHFLTYYKRVETGCHVIEGEILFLLKSHTKEVLKILEDKQNYYDTNMGKKKTKFLMKTCKQWVLDKLEKISLIINFPVLAKFLSKNEIIPFLLKHGHNLGNLISDFDILKHFIRNLPDDERFQFVKKTFIDNSKKVRGDLTGSDIEEQKNAIDCNVSLYRWYEFAPFEIALTELKKLIHSENAPSERCAILSVLITCAKPNPQQIKTLLSFYYEKHINEPFKFKIQFINDLLSQIPVYEFDVETWKILDQLFHSMDVYAESENKVQLCLQSIILYKVLHDEVVPDIVKQKITFTSFKDVQNNLNEVQRDKIFNYLLKTLETTIQSIDIINESDYSKIIQQLKNAQTLLTDWKKDIRNYPFIVDKIKELIKIKAKNIWTTDLTDLYNMNKSWRKYMFEESLILCPSEETCLNVLKHKPQLLMQHDKQIEMLRTKDAVSLSRLLAKLRVYWPDTLAQYWTDAYLDNLNKPTGQKAVVKGLFVLLPQNQIIDMAKKHVPEEFKVKWGETDQNEINIRKNIALHLHLTRPQIPLDTILWYAKGDYLQYAVPSLNAVLCSSSKVESREHLPKLLEAPVSLQKYGLHLAFSKLNYDEQKLVFSKIWNNTKNHTIRSILFKHTYAQLCKINDPTAEKELWQLLSMFIDNLNAEENKEIYKTLGMVRNVPISVRAQFFMKGYVFLTSLPDSANCISYVKNLVQYAPNVLESLDEDFVVDTLLSPIDKKVTSYRSEFMELFACYALCGKSEQDQGLKSAITIVSK